MKRLLSLVLIPLLLSSNSLAIELKYVQAGTPAPFTGYLISLETEQHFRLMDKELIYHKELNVALENINKTYQNNQVIMQQRIENQQSQINNLTDRLGKDDSFFGKLGMFLLGAGMASLIAFGAVRAVK